MNVYFVLNGITFVWNDEKAQSNPSEHGGITLQQAAEAFLDPFLIVMDASCNDETRGAIVGMDRCWNLLYVVHSEREESVIEIISARQATHQERKDYED
jgi:uncharacterized DUF497 family protein